jgi:hypothetical protein
VPESRILLKPARTQEILESVRAILWERVQSLHSMKNWEKRVFFSPFAVLVGRVG